MSVRLLALLACATVAACADSRGLYARYLLEKKFFEAQQAWSKAELMSESGQAPPHSELRAQLQTVLGLFSEARPTLGAHDSTLFAYAAQTAFQLIEEFTILRLWHDAARYQELIASDSLFPAGFRHRALYGWGESCERLGQVTEAAVHYRHVAASFYPPWSEDGVNVEVLRIPNHLLALAQRYLPDSAAAYQAFGEVYYDSLARRFPHTDLAYQALGELGKLYGQAGRWEDVMTTLRRAVDSAGVVLPAYRIDIGEILASKVHDTAGALREFQDLAEAFPESPFRLDADLKTAVILYRRGRYADVQALLQNTKRQFEASPGVGAAVGLPLARSYAAAGNKERARAEYSYMVTTFPRTLQAVEAALATAELDAQSNDSSGAAEWFGRADRLAADLAADSESPPEVVGTAMNIRVSLAVQSQSWDDAAMRLAEIAQAFSPASPAGGSALMRLGWLQLRERHDTLAAAQAWQAFLTVYPDHPDGGPLKTEMSKWPERFIKNAAS